MTSFWESTFDPFFSDMPQSKFLLRCCPNRNLDINLPDGVDVIIGRNRLTKLKDFRLSRKHASLTADENTERIEFIQLGANSSFITKKSSVEGMTYVTYSTIDVESFTGRAQINFSSELM